MATELSTTLVAEVRSPAPAARQEAIKIRAVTATNDRQGESVVNQVDPAAEKAEAVGGNLQSTVQDLNEMIQNVRRNLQFSIDDDSGRTVVKVIDAETNEVVRQIPSDEVLAMARHLDEQITGPGLIFGDHA
jgi:flagellar protein FlaG